MLLQTFNFFYKSPVSVASGGSLQVVSAPVTFSQSNVVLQQGTLSILNGATVSVERAVLNVSGDVTVRNQSSLTLNQTSSFVLGGYASWGRWSASGSLMSCSQSYHCRWRDFHSS